MSGPNESESNRRSDRGPWVTVQEAARLLNVHPNTLRRWGNRGFIRTFRVGPRGDRRYRRQDVDDLLWEQARRLPAGQPGRIR